MNWADVIVVACGALAVVCAAVCHLAAKTCSSAADDVIEHFKAWTEARAEHNEHDRKSLKVWLEINEATRDGRPVADWAWAWAHGIDEDD